MEPERTEDELWALMLSVDAELDEESDMVFGAALMDGTVSDYRVCTSCGEFVWHFDKPSRGGKIKDKQGLNFKKSVCWKCSSAQAKQWRRDNPERFKENIERWESANREKVRKMRLRNVHRRQARLAGIPGEGMSQEQEAAELRRLDNKCALCEVEMVHYSTHKEMLDEWSAVRGKKYWGHPQYRTIEHKKPVASGVGSNKPEDLTFTCSSCNKGVGSWQDRVERAKSRKEGK
jgi:hypothetical protein